MAGYIRKRGQRADGSTKWQARYWDPADPTKRYEKVFRTKGEASNWLTQQQHALLTGTHIAPQAADTRFRDVASVWKDTWVDLGPNTRAGYEMTLRAHLLPEFGARKVSTITPRLVQSYVARLLKEGSKPGTVRNIYAVLRNALNTAVRLKLIQVNPCQGVKLPRMPRESMLFLTAPEVNGLAEQVAHPVQPDGRPAKPHPEYNVLVMTAAWTGLRAGELLALTRADVDLLHGVIHVRRALKEVHGVDAPPGEQGLIFGPTKTHEQRKVSIPAFLKELLTEHLARPLPGGNGPEALVFASPTGQPLRHGLFYRRHFKPAVRAAIEAKELPAAKAGLRFHDLRHTAASLMVAAGAHPKAVMERMGHSDIRITMNRYAHLYPGDDLALADALDAAHTAALAPPTNVRELRNPAQRPG